MILNLHHRLYPFKNSPIFNSIIVGKKNSVNSFEIPSYLIDDHHDHKLNNEGGIKDADIKMEEKPAFTHLTTFHQLWGILAISCMNPHKQSWLACLRRYPDFSFVYYIAVSRLNE